MPNQSNDKNIPSVSMDFNKILDIEIDSLKASLLMQKHVNNMILDISDKLLSQMNSSKNIHIIHKISSHLYEISSFSMKLQNNITSLEKLESQLEFLKSTIDFTNSNEEYTNFFGDKIEKSHNEYLKLIDDNLHFSEIVNEFILKISTFDYNILAESKSTEITEEKTDKENIIEENINKEDIIKNVSEEINDNQNNNDINNQIDDEFKNINIKENTLIITDKEVILPFTKIELEKELESSGYTCIEDIINEKYTKDISYFKPSAISRFRESYLLILEKEHGTKLQAARLALELFTNYNLHPAIITACKDLNQLDIYLSCLEYNELQDFHFFEINYSIPPISKKHFMKNLLLINKKKDCSN